MPKDGSKLPVTALRYVPKASQPFLLVATCMMMTLFILLSLYTLFIQY